MIKENIYRNYIYFQGNRIQKSSSATDQIKKFNAEHRLFRFPNSVVEVRNILIKSMEIGVVVNNHLQLPKTMFLPQIILKITI